MAKWSLFKKSKPEDESTAKQETQEVTSQEEPEQDCKPLAEYKETLYTSTKASKKTNKEAASKEQRYWRDVDSIEKKVDELHITYAKKPKTAVDKTVDKLIEKRNKK